MRSPPWRSHACAESRSLRRGNGCLRCNSFCRATAPRCAARAQRRAASSPSAAARRALRRATRQRLPGVASAPCAVAAATAAPGAPTKSPRCAGNFCFRCAIAALRRRAASATGGAQAPLHAPAVCGGRAAGAAGVLLHTRPAGSRRRHASNDCKHARHAAAAGASLGPLCLLGCALHVVRALAPHQRVERKWTCARLTVRLVRIFAHALTPRTRRCAQYFEVTINAVGENLAQVRAASCHAGAPRVAAHGETCPTHGFLALSATQALTLQLLFAAAVQRDDDGLPVPQCAVPAGAAPQVRLAARA